MLIGFESNQKQPLMPKGVEHRTVTGLKVLNVQLSTFDAARRFELVCRKIKVRCMGYAGRMRTVTWLRVLRKLRNSLEVL